MTWRLLDRPKTQKVTQKLAKTFAEMDPAPHDRPLSERRLAVYEKLFKLGQFRPVTWATAICIATGGIYRVNGKHTSILLLGLLSGSITIPDFFVTVEEYECDTLEDVAKLYATFDSNMQSRTANDIYLSFAATLPDLKDIARRVITASVAGISYATWFGDLSNHQPAERAELLLDSPEFVMWVDDVLKERDKLRQYYRQPVVAAMFSTWCKAKGASDNFWKAVIEETGDSPKLPDRKLAKYLTVTGMMSKTNNTKMVAGTREMYAKCIHAWNAWRKNEQTDLKYYADKKVPVAY